MSMNKMIGLKKISADVFVNVDRAVVETDSQGK